MLIVMTLLLFGHHQNAEFRAQKINFYYSTIDDGSRIHAVRPRLYQQRSVAMRAMGSVIARFLGVSVRGCVEFLLARCRAEIVGLPLPDFACRGLFALDRHATDRIGDLHLLSLLSLEHHAFDMEHAIGLQHFVRDGAALNWR